MTDFVTQVRQGSDPDHRHRQNRDSFDATGHINDTLGGYPRPPARSRPTPTPPSSTSTPCPRPCSKPWAPYRRRPRLHEVQSQQLSRRQNATSRQHPLQQLRRLRARALHRPRHPRDKLPIAKFLDPGVPDFDPAHPDVFADFHLPYTPPRRRKTYTTKIPQANLK
jgi:hypothetical protein